MGSPKIPQPPAIQMPPPQAHPPTLGSSATQLAASLEKQKAMANEGQGMDNTILTSPSGTPSPYTAKPGLK